MDVYVTDDQIGLYFRRIQLGLRFLSHGARTQTTSLWTKSTPDQLATLRRRWNFSSDDRLRGPSPSSFQVFFRSARCRKQAALFLCICRIVGIAPSRTGADAVRMLPSIENGERFCEAVEIFREWQPDADFEFEQLMLLLTGAVEAGRIELAGCSGCEIAVLLNKLMNDPEVCLRCRRLAARRPSRSRLDS